MKGIEGLSSEKLAAVLQVVTEKLRESRKKATQLVSKEKRLSSLWLATLSSAIADGEMTPEQIKAKRVEVFEAELLNHPEAFVHYQIMTHLITFEVAVREEQHRRRGPRK